MHADTLDHAKVVSEDHCLLIAIVLKTVLKFIEMVLKCENDLEISKFYQPLKFSKSSKMMRFLKFSKFLKMIAEEAPVLRVTRAETRLTVNRSLP